jgi:hypothetical protein
LLAAFAKELAAGGTRMTNSDEDGERRRKYFEEYGDRVDRHRSRQAYFDNNAIEFASNAMRAMTYLNGVMLLMWSRAVLK